MAFVQQFTGTNNSGAANTCAITVPAQGVPVGHFLSVCYGTTGTMAAPTCADNKGNVYTRDVLNTSTTNLPFTMFSTVVTAALVSGDTITCTKDGAAAGPHCATAIEFSNTTGTFDKSAGAGNVTTTSPASGVTAARTQALELLIGCVCWFHTAAGDTFAAGTNYQGGTTCGPAGATNRTYLGTEYQLVSATGTDQADGTISGSRLWGMSVATYVRTSDGDMQWVANSQATSMNVGNKRVRTDWVELGHTKSGDPDTDTGDK